MSKRLESVTSEKSSRNQDDSVSNSLVTLNNIVNVWVSCQ